MPKKGKEKPTIHRQSRWTSSCCALRSIRDPFVLILNGFMNTKRVSVSFWIGDWLGRVEKIPKFNICFKWRRKFVAVRLVLAKQICTDFTWGFSILGPEDEFVSIYLWHVKRVFHSLLISFSASFRWNWCRHQCLHRIEEKIDFMARIACSLWFRLQLPSIHSVRLSRCMRVRIFGHSFVHANSLELHNENNFISLLPSPFPS